MLIQFGFKLILKISSPTFNMNRKNMENHIKIYLLSFVVGLMSLVMYVFILAPRYIIKFKDV